MHELATPLLVGLVIIALAFDFLNGLHDAANSIATVVSTRLISPVWAVVFAAFGNFAAYWIMGLKVADTIGKGIINKDIVTPGVVFGALVGAMFWNVVTWIRGIPSSSSHALLGGLLGAGIAHAGLGAVSQLCGMLFQKMLGAELTTVPYSGTAPALNALLGGQVDILCDQTTQTLPHIKAEIGRAHV